MKAEHDKLLAWISGQLHNALIALPNRDIIAGGVMQLIVATIMRKLADDMVSAILPCHADILLPDINHRNIH